MKIVFSIEASEIVQINEFYNQYKDNYFVQQRTAWNLSEIKKPPTVNEFWEALVMCLLSTQQRSGPNSPISRLLNTQPFLIGWDIIMKQENIENYTVQVLTDFGGIRRANTIANQLQQNLNYLRTSNFEIIQEISTLIHQHSRLNEVRLANRVSDTLKGIGQKQSRNLLQYLGLTIYEIPIDSRITKWLNKFGFPILLSATALQDKHYYDFIMDGFNVICDHCGIYPCQLDAAIFVSFDKDEWNETNLVY